MDFDFSNWDSYDPGYADIGDLGGGFESGYPEPGWVSGYDLPGGGDTGNPVGPGSSFDVGPGQIPSEVYQYLIQHGGLGPGMSTSMPTTGGGGGGGGAGGGAGGASLADLMKGLGGVPGLLGILGALGGGFYAQNRTSKANEQMQDAIKTANEQLTSTLGGNAALYDPYRAAGAVGLQRLQNQPQSNLAAGFAPIADRYKPLGTGAGFSLGNVAKGR